MQQSVSVTSINHRISNQPDVLESMSCPSVDLSLWQRPPQALIEKELKTLKADSLPHTRFRTTPDTFDRDIEALFKHQSLNTNHFTNFRSDLSQLMRRFSRLSRTKDLCFRLFTTNKNDCKRFHLDRVNLRLICTYQGTGTEWLTGAQVDREAQLAGEPNSSIMRFGSPQQLETYWVGIMRGDPKNLGQGLIHRSPTIEGSDQVRIVFSLDQQAATI